MQSLSLDELLGLRNAYYQYPGVFPFTLYIYKCFVVEFKFVFQSKTHNGRIERVMQSVAPAIDIVLDNRNCFRKFIISIL